jgi:fructose-1,6-bisphosphatase I
MKLENSFMSFLLKHQQRHGRTLNFVILMDSVITAAKQIRQAYIEGALTENLGEHGSVNVQGEDVMALDILAHKIVMHNLKESNQVIQAVSEEAEEAIELNKDGRYFFYFDPLDGSSNIKHSLPVGFLFGIAKRNLDGREDNKLRRGDELIASGMFLCPSGDFTFALRDAGSWHFILNATNSLVRPVQVHFPTATKTWELSFNSGNRHTFSNKVRGWIEAKEDKFNFRYAGSLAVDFHRLLNNGGMFCYPAIINHPNPKKNRPDGKLRLLYECNVVALIAREAGGIAIDEKGRNILEVQPESNHQRTAIYVGSPEVIEEIREVLRH